MDMALVTKHVVNYCQGRAFAVHFTVRGLLSAVVQYKTEDFSYESGRAMRVTKVLKEDWPIVLQ